MITKRLTPWVVVLTLLMAPVATAVTVFQDDFSGAGGALNGTTPDTTTGAAAWEAGSTWLDNGVAGTTVASSANGQAAHLDYTPLSGKIYTAEATILNTNPNWIGFGFLPLNPSGGDWTVTDFSVRHSNAPGYAWMLNRLSTGNDQEGFLGGGTAGGRPWNGDVVDPNNPVNIKIVLDTTGANWTAEWIINNVSQGAPVAFGAAGNPGIGGIGFSHDRNASANSGGIISDFSLTFVPEPGTIALAGLGLVGLLASRGRRD